MGKHVSVTKLQRETAAGAELISLLQTVTSDGRLSPQEVQALCYWLTAHLDSELPAIAFLSERVADILTDGVVTEDEVDELFAAIEKALPKDIRAGVRGTRRVVELEQEQRRREERELKKAEEAALKVQIKEEQRARREAERKEEEERQRRNAPIEWWEFTVAGVAYGSRDRIVHAYVQPGDRVFLVRDLRNAFSENAVEVRLSNGMQIGFVPERFAKPITRLLVKGNPYIAEVEKIFEGSTCDIPVLDVRFHYKRTDIDGLATEADAPAKTEPPPDLPQRPAKDRADRSRGHTVTLNFDDILKAAIAKVEEGAREAAERGEFTVWKFATPARTLTAADLEREVREGSVTEAHRVFHPDSKTWVSVKLIPVAEPPRVEPPAEPAPAPSPVPPAKIPPTDKRGCLGLLLAIFGR